MKMAFSGRTIGFWLGVGASALMSIAAVVFLVVNGGDKTFSFVTFGAIMLGCVAEIVFIFTRFGVLNILAAAAYGVALGYHLMIGLPSVSDRVNGVNFIGGNADMVIVFSIVFVIGTLAAVVSSYMGDSKSSFEIATS